MEEDKDTLTQAGVDQINLTLKNNWVAFDHTNTICSYSIVVKTVNKKMQQTVLYQLRISAYFLNLVVVVFFFFFLFFLQFEARKAINE